MPSASDYIRALVSGLPSAERDARPMAILQAYVDESEQKVDDPPIGRPPLKILSYVGYVATSETWQMVSDEWKACLDASPRIDYLKMSEAMGFNVQFRGWQESSRDKKISDLYLVMQRHIKGGACFVLSLTEFDKLREFFPNPKMRNKFFYSSYGLMHNAARFLDALGLNGDIDFIFDHQMGIEGKVQDAWDDFRNSGVIPSNRLGETPIFRNEKSFMPLQAADLGAWVIGRRTILKYRGEQPRFVWENNGSTYQMVGKGVGKAELLEHLGRCGVDISSIPPSGD